MRWSLASMLLRYACCLPLAAAYAPAAGLAGSARTIMEMIAHHMQGAAPGAPPAPGFPPFAAPAQSPAEVNGELWKDIGIVADECKTVPKIVLEDLHRNECPLNATEMFGTLTLMMKKMTEKEKATAMGENAELLRSEMHKEVVSFCKHPECTTGMQALLEHTGRCNSAAVCAAMTAQSGGAFEMCRGAVSMMLGQAARNMGGTMCQVEPGTETFCGEVDSALMVGNFDCWKQLHHQSRGCKPECAKIWKDTRKRFPVCSSNYMENQARTQSMARGMLGKLLRMGMGGPGGPRPGGGPGWMMRSFGEICEEMPGGGRRDDASLDSWAQNLFNGPSGLIQI